jgi:very-short-patch-repair endonuclease
MGAVLWAGEGSLVSHASAAREWAIDGVRCRKPEIWVPSGCTKKSTRVDVHRGTRLDRADRTVLDGIPITTPTRTLIDISGRLEDEALLAAMEAAFRSGLATPDRLAARLEALRTPGRVGAGRLERLLAARPLGAAVLESRLEARVWRLIERSGLPLPERQLWVVAGGNRYRLDFAWPELRVAVECKGFAFHGGREHFDPGEDRTAELVAAHWRVVPVTWQQATKSPDRVLDRLARLLGRASSASARQFIEI